MNILITGGAGFIGSSLADRLLSLGYNIIVADNFNDYYNPKIKEKNVSHNIGNTHYLLERMDIVDPVACDHLFTKYKFDCVVHLAARAGVRPSLENPRLYADTNIIGTINILESMKKAGCKKLIFASSSSVYGNCKAELFSEDMDVSKPISPYAATKAANESFCYTYSKLYGIKTVALRFFTVYGPRQRPDLAIRKFIELIDADKKIPVYGDGSTVRDYTFISDILSGIIAAINYEQTPFEIINLAGGRQVSLLEMIHSIENALQKRANVEFLPMQPGDVDKTAGDISKARKLLDYNPQVSFDFGIEKTVEWLMEGKQ
jgi:UDP-glucuronate 4-epimerase